MTPEQTRLLLDFVLPTLSKETATTAKVIAAAPEDRLDYRPSERSMPAGRLLWHIAAADVALLEGVVTGTFGKMPEQPADVKTPREISAWYADKTGALIGKMSAFTPEESARILDFGGFMQAPAAGIVTFILGHSIHHRGQLSAYLRPMGGKVPAIYGASGDENPFAKAEEAIA